MTQPTAVLGCSCLPQNPLLTVLHKFTQIHPNHAMAKQIFLEVAQLTSIGRKKETAEPPCAPQNFVPDHSFCEPPLASYSFQQSTLGSGDGSFARTPNNDLGASVLTRSLEQVAALAKLLRLPARWTDVRVNEASGQRDSVPNQQEGRPLKYVTLLAGVLTCIWGWRAGRSIERVVARRYSDIAYQIRRPDALSARISAFKVLVLGGLVVPGSAVVFAGWQCRVQSLQQSRGAHEFHGTLEVIPAPGNFGFSMRPRIAEVLPLPLHNEMRRLVGFHLRPRSVIHLRCSGVWVLCHGLSGWT